MEGNIKVKLTLCVICKDEEKKIVRCLRSAKEVVDAMVVVDTGSTDKTVQLAQAEGATVYEIPWEDSFSKARNYAINQVQEGWIIFIDADEYFTESSLPFIRPSIENAATHHKDYVLMEIINQDDKGLMGTLKYIKAFRKDKHIYYVYDIHEALCKDNGELLEWDASDKLKLLHDGYQKDAVGGKDKEQRNEKMLLKELEKNPHNIDVHFYLMQNYLCQNRPDKVIEYGEKVLKAKKCNIWGAIELTYTYILNACRNLDLPYEKIKAYYEAGIRCNQAYPDFDYYYGLYHYKINDYENCIKYLEICLQKVGQYKDRIASYAVGSIEDILIIQSNSYIEMARYQESVNLLVKILRINPEHASVLYNLILIIQQQESAEAIGGFLCKIYDLNNARHLMLLLGVIKQCNNEALYQYFYLRTPDIIKQQLS